MTVPEIVDRCLPDGVLGQYDRDRNVIEIDPRQPESQYRCTLRHEWNHAKRGDHHTGNTVIDAKQEAAVDEETACDMIPFAKLADAIVFDGFDIAALADTLHVDEDTVQCRLDNLDTQEDQQLTAMFSRIEASA